MEQGQDQIFHGKKQCHIHERPSGIPQVSILRKISHRKNKTIQTILLIINILKRARMIYAYMLGQNITAILALLRRFNVGINFIDCDYIDSRMLTSEQSKLRLRVIIILIVIAVLCLTGAIIVIIVAQNNGFSGNSSLTCATGTQTYFLSKYKAYDNGLRVSFIGAIFAFTVGIIIAILLGPRLVKINKLPENEVKEQTHQIIENITSATYILVSLCLIANMVPLAYNASLVRQASSKCLSSLDVNWLMIAVLTAVAEILFIICLVIVIRMRVLMEHQEVKKESVKDINENKVDPTEGEIVNQQNQQKAPLLDKQNQHNHPELPAIIQQRPSRFANQQQHKQTKNSKYQPFTNTQAFTPQQIQQKSQKQLEKAQSILPPPSNTTSNGTPQSSKVQIKPQASQNVTHINFNFPSNFPLGQPIVNQQSLSSKKINHQQQKREVIKQSMQEELSSDSDDHYYKRARKTKKRRFNFEQDEIGKSNQNRKNNEVDYERQFERISSKFQESPSQPRYVVLSPQSIKTFYQFVKNDQNSKRKMRNFTKPQNSREKPYQHGKKRKRHQQTDANHLRPTDDIVMSQVKQFPHKDHLHQSYSKRQELRQRSIYEKLDVGNEIDEGNMKKYEKFFKSSRQLNQYQLPSQKTSDLDEYFNLLNSNSGNKQGEANYRSVSNYSSVLNEQARGKMPIQREQQSYHNRINLEDNRIRSIKKNSTEKKDVLAQIRNKYS